MQNADHEGRQLLHEKVVSVKYLKEDLQAELIDSQNWFFSWGKRILLNDLIGINTVTLGFQLELSIFRGNQRIIKYLANLGMT